MTKDKEKKVYAKKGDVILLKSKFNCSNTAVSRALNFRVNSAQARTIRSYAINFLKCYFII